MKDFEMEKENLIKETENKFKDYYNIKSQASSITSVIFLVFALISLILSKFEFFILLGALGSLVGLFFALKAMNWDNKAKERKIKNLILAFLNFLIFSGSLYLINDKNLFQPKENEPIIEDTTESNFDSLMIDDDKIKDLEHNIENPQEAPPPAPN